MPNRSRSRSSSVTIKRKHSQSILNIEHLKTLERSPVKFLDIMTVCKLEQRSKANLPTESM